MLIWKSQCKALLPFIFFHLILIWRLSNDNQCECSPILYSLGTSGTQKTNSPYLGTMSLGGPLTGLRSVVMQEKRVGDRVGCFSFWKVKWVTLLSWVMCVLVSGSTHKFSCSVVPGCFVTPWTVACSSVHGILQVRILEGAAISSSRGSSWSRDRPRISCVSCIGRQILHHCATWEAPSGSMCMYLYISL